MAIKCGALLEWTKLLEITPTKQLENHRKANRESGLLPDRLLKFLFDNLPI